MKIGLYGASGHGKVLLETCRLVGISRVFLYDDNELISTLLDVKVSHTILNGYHWVISIGDNQIRKDIVQKTILTYCEIIHPSSMLSESLIIGKGTVVMAGVIVNADVVVGEHVILNTNCSVDHDCIVDSFSHISPGVTLCGGVTIEEGVHVGAGAVILPGIKIGAWSIIGAGAVIVRDVPARSTVVGNPGKIVKLKC